MHDFLSKLNLSGETAEFIAAAKTDNTAVFGFGNGERVITASAVIRDLAGTTVYICADEYTAKKAYEAFKGINENVLFLPAKDDVVNYRDIRSYEIAAKRLDALTKSVLTPDCLVVTSIEAVLQIFPLRKDIEDNIITFITGGGYDLDGVVKRLINAGYKRETAIENYGQFSLRGDILDIFPPGQSGGFRLDFFGDNLESINSLDIATLKSGEEMLFLALPPNTEIFYSETEANEILKKLPKEVYKPVDPSTAERYYALYSKLESALCNRSKDMRLSFLAPLFKHCGFMEFFKPSAVFFDDGRDIANQISILTTEHESRVKTALNSGEGAVSSKLQLSSGETALAFRCPKTAYFVRDAQNRLFTTDKIFHFKSVQVLPYHRNFTMLYDDVKTWMSGGKSVYIFAGGGKQGLEEFFASQPPLNTGRKGRLEIFDDTLGVSAVFFNEGIILIGTPALKPPAVKKTVKRLKKDAFTEPCIGGYVVHRIHGIGFCESVSKLNIGGSERDYAVIRYAGNDKLYVPVENMDSLSRYGDGDAEPKLSKIGGAEFARAKERVRASVKKMAFSLLELYKERSDIKGFKYPETRELDDEFAAAFPYTDTDDQVTAAEECLGDLESGKIMDRLLCGDVGYGKTEVALRAAYKVICAGKQVAFLSPTTILANQHFNTALKRMEPFGVSVGILSRFQNDAEIKKTLEGIQTGKTDIVCGTHRLLSKDVRFKDLGLLILDEEQRFGVQDKEKIKALKKDVNVLTLSATPIPRTLHMSLSGIRDISLLDTPPEDRLPVRTFVCEYTENLVYDAVMREVGRGGQAFIVYNRVETIESFAAGIKNLFDSGFKIAVAHGRMDPQRLENTVSDFKNGKTDILIASTIIENGIDMPNANTLIVIDSDRFGLSQLYQLRGRVGRSHRLAYAYFTYDAHKILTENAVKRLDAVTQFTEFGSGFKIAMRDLEIRGAGDILGREQHGHIENVGYDTYYKILAEAVEEMKGGRHKDENPEVKVFTDFNAYIPENYIDDDTLRLRVYTRIAAIDSPMSKKNLIDELTEVYGAVPSPVDNLLTVALFKSLAAKISAESVTLKKTEASVKFSKVSDIPGNVSKFPFCKINPLSASVSFGKDRAGLLKFLLRN